MKMYYITYWEVNHNVGEQHTMTIEEATDLEAIMTAKALIAAKAEYMDVVEDSFIVEDAEKIVAQFEYGKLIKGE